MSNKFKTSITRRSMIAAGALALCTGAFAQANDNTIRLLVQGPYTGGSSSMGVSIRDGVRLAVSEINKSGGIIGKKIELIERNDEAKNDVGVKIGNEAVNSKVHAVIGIANAGVALAGNRYFQDAKIPVIISASAGALVTRQFEDQTENYIFRIAAHDNLQAPLMVEEAVIKRGLKKIAILGDTTGYGQGGRVDLEQSLALKRIIPVHIDSFKIGDKDMTVQLKKAREAGADAILAFGIGPELAAIANSKAKIEWDAPLIGPWTASMASFIEDAGKNGDGARMPQTFIQSSKFPKRQEFVESYLKTFRPEDDRIPSPVSAAQSYDAVYVLAAAIRQANSLDGSKIRTALENLKEPVEGVVTTYSRPFNRFDHEAITSNMVIFGEVKNGRVGFSNESDMNRGVTMKIAEDRLDLFKR